MGMGEKENSQTSRSSFRRMYVQVEVRKKKKKMNWRRYNVWVLVLASGGAALLRVPGNLNFLAAPPRPLD